MSIATELVDMETFINDAYNAAEENGATMPTQKNLQNLKPTIESIEGGGSGPTFIDYIESTGTQYIDTGVLPNSNMKVEIDFQIIGHTVVEAEWQPIWGFSLYNSTNQINLAGYYNVNDKTRVNILYGSNNIQGNLSSPVTNRTKLTYEKTGLYENGNQVISGLTESTFKETVARRSIIIFGLRTDDVTYPQNYTPLNRPQLMKLYSFKVYENDSLIRNFKPCIDPNGVYCLYELVEGKYYYNQGTGEFRGDGWMPTQLEYIESTGIQYIDTGFIPNQDTTVEMRVNIPEVVDQKWLFGSNNSGTEGFSLFIFNPSHTYILFRYGTDGGDYSDPELQNIVGLDITIKADKNTLYYDNRVIESLEEQTFNCNNPLFLLAVNRYGSVDERMYSCKLYGTKIYDNGTLIRDYIPALDENNVAALWDKVSQAFFYNQGTGSFTAGPVVKEV